MTLIKTKNELIDFMRTHEGVDVTDIEAGICIDFLKSGNICIGWEDGKYYKVSLLDPSCAVESTLTDILIYATRQAETMAEGMILQMNIYNNIEDAHYSDVVSQDSLVLAALADKFSGR